MSQIPKLTNKQNENRLRFAIAHQEWTVDDWKRVMWSDESPFELFPTPNRQNDRVRARNPEDVPLCQQVKFPAKVHVWDMMSYRVLSELYIVPKGKTINEVYYRDHILAKICKAAFKRRAKRGSVLKRAMASKMSEIIFQQDGAPAHRRRTRGGRGGLSPPSYQTQGARGGPSGGTRGGS